MSLCVDGFHAEGLEVKQIWSINCVFNLRLNIAVKLLPHVQEKLGFLLTAITVFNFVM